jgi:hypothetical protein
MSRAGGKGTMTGCLGCVVFELQTPRLQVVCKNIMLMFKTHHPPIITDHI